MHVLIGPLASLTYVYRQINGAACFDGLRPYVFCQAGEERKA